MIKVSRVLVLAVSVSLAVAVQAQSAKSVKQAESLEQAGESAKASVQTVLDGLDKLLGGYNSIVRGEAKDPQGAYKKLVKQLDGTGKSIETARKQVTVLGKEADKFFGAWEQDLESISSESLRDKSAARLDTARKRYASMGETLAQAREEFAPVIQNLNDQILYLGRDLSPAALADLQDEADELNRQAAEVTEKVRSMLQSAGQEQAEAEAEIDAGE